MSRITGQIRITATAIEPIHHGAGTSGNTSLLRTQEVVTPDGTLEAVPFISGNSLKHMIRESGVRFALAAMGVEDGSLTKPIVDLLFSGGALTKAGAAVDLSRSRKLEELFPILSLCGYSAGNVMTGSKLKIDNLHLACEENAWRVPEGIAVLPVAKLAAGALRAREFGTRHESSRRPHVARLLTAWETARLEGKASADLAVQHADKGDSAQMIYSYQVIKPGAVLWGAIHLSEISELELGALRAGLEYACEGTDPRGGLLFRLGAKGSIGCGRVSMHLDGFARAPVAPTLERSEALATIGASGKADLDGYATHLRERRAEILSLLAEMVA